MLETEKHVFISSVECKANVNEMFYVTFGSCRKNRKDLVRVESCLEAEPREILGN